MCIRDRFVREGEKPAELAEMVKVQTPDCKTIADVAAFVGCLLYTSDAADERSSVDLGGRRIIKKKNEDSNRGRAGVTQQIENRTSSQRYDKHRAT